jgi:hypothetical protein
LTPPQRTDPAKLRDYRYCGGYDEDVTAKLKEAENYIRQHAHDTDPRKPAIVLDIDETSLSNWLDIETVILASSRAVRAASKRAPRAVTPPGS